MPLYEIEHSIPLDKSQRHELAQAITHIHTRKFATPSLFVNIRFIDANSRHNYVAGKEVGNYQFLFSIKAREFNTSLST